MSHATFSQTETLGPSSTPSPVFSKPDPAYPVNLLVGQGLADGFYNTIDQALLHKSEYRMGVNIGQIQKLQGAREPQPIAPTKRNFLKLNWDKAVIAIAATSIAIGIGTTVAVVQDAGMVQVGVISATANLSTVK